MVNKKLLAELKVILEEDFGCGLTMAEVTEIANAFINYFDLLIRINALKKL